MNDIKFGYWALGLLFLTGCTTADTAIRGDMRALETRIETLETRLKTVENRAGIQSRAAAVPQKVQTEIKVQPVAPAAPENTLTNASLEAQEEFLELPSVSQVQQALKNAGFFQGDVDGKTGPMTKGAIREFQRVNGLQVDGVMGAQTWKMLKTHLGNS